MEMAEIDLWLSRVDDVVTRFRGPKLVVEFDEMLAHPRETVYKVADFLCVPVTESALGVISPKISKFSREQTT